MTEYTFTAKQQEFVDAVLNGESVFLKGKAGTGKTFVVKKVMEMLKEENKKVAAIAPTGIAASNVGGATVHSLFSLPVHCVIDYSSCRYINRDKRRLLEKIEILLIDEVSMLRADMLDGIDYTLKKNNCGGLATKQLIFIGDMKQLPPVANDNFLSVMMNDPYNYAGVEFENALFLKNTSIRVIELDEIKRQSDHEFITALNIVRDGGKSPYFKNFLNRGIKGVILAPNKDTVSRHNIEGLSKLPGEEYRFPSSVDGNARAEDFNLDDTIVVKDGAKIMYLINSSSGQLVNGTIGEFKSRMVSGVRFVDKIDEDGEVIQVQETYEELRFFIKVGSIEYDLKKVTLTKQEYVYDPELDRLTLKTLGSITQYPFRLAYALTIHKSQGLTFDEVTVDLSSPCFSPGQLYVALSRVRTPEGLSIIMGDRLINKKS